MTEQTTQVVSLKPIWARSPIWTSLLILIAGALLSGWLAVRADREMREDLLARTRMVAKAVDLDYVRRLTGTEADLESPDYLRLKEQLIAIRTAEPQCRFVYLMGRKPSGEVFIFVDSEPVDSEYHEPPGLIYGEVTAEELRVFDTASTLTMGPYDNRWGTWITALVPLIDPQSGEVIAAFGIDIAARDWWWNVAGRTALPVGLVWLLVIGLLTVLFATTQAPASPEPVLRRLMPGLTVMLLLLLGAGFWGWTSLHEKQLRENSLQIYQEAVVNFKQLLAEQVLMLEVAQTSLLSNPDLAAAIQAGDRDRLFELTRPLFEDLKSRHSITHSFLSDPDRITLLRHCNLDLCGDRLDLSTALESERIQGMASGIEVGLVGSLVLRVVQPLFDNGQLLGYVAMGKEIEDVLDRLVQPDPIEMILAIRKDLLDRERWEAGRAMLKREIDWDRLPDHAVIYASTPVPIEAENMIGSGGRDHDDAFSPFRSGGKIWRATTHPVADADGRELGELLLLHDVTEMIANFRHRLTVAVVVTVILMAALLGMTFAMLRRTDASIRAQQAELIEGQNRLHMILENINDNVWCYDTDSKGNFISSFISPVGARMLGISEAELHHSFDVWFSHVLPEDLPRVQEAMAEAVAGRGRPEEYRIRAADGAVKWIRSKGDLVQKPDGSRSLVGTGADITEQKRTEEALRLQSLVLNQIEDRVSVTDLAGRITYINQAEVDALGFTREEILNQTTEVYGEDPQRGATQREILETTLRDGHWRGEVVNYAKDGSSLIMDCRTQVVCDEREQPVALCGIATDISERKKAEEELLKMNRHLEAATARANDLAEQAARANAAKSVFLANMSHEIRTPMNGMLGMNRLLLETGLTDEQQRYARTAISSGESLLRIINDILDFSKIEAGKLELETVDFDLPGLLNDIALTLGPQAQAKGISLRCTVDPDVPQRVAGDPVRLRQILTNLTGNAVKFTSQGDVTVHVGRATGTSPDATTESNEEPCAAVSLRFSVTDTGSGIPPDRLDCLFQPFSQVDSSITRQFGGTGLGLAISRQLVELMGGDIRVESEVGRGSTFWFVVPLRTDLDAAVEDTRPETAERIEWAGYFAGCNARILLVEDNVVNQQVALGMLELLGLEADTANDGQAALDAIRQNAYDLVLMDVRMPGVDGLEATRQIRALEQRQTTENEERKTKSEARKTKNKERIPIIAITAHAMLGDRRECLDAGMDDYLAKPIDPVLLGQVLRRWLPVDGAVPPKVAAAKPTTVDKSAPSTPLGATAGNLPVLAWENVLKRMMGNQRIANTVLKAAIGSVPVLLEHLERAVAAEDLDGVVEYAHALKGAASNVGAETLRELAKTLEDAGRKGDLDRIRVKTPELAATTAAFLEAANALVE